MDSQRSEKDQPESLENKLAGINYKQYFKQAPPLADLERTYDLIEEYTNFKKIEMSQSIKTNGLKHLSLLRVLQIQSLMNCTRWRLFNVVYAWNFY